MANVTPDGSTLQFLHRLDAVQGDQLFVETTRDDLGRATFLDGRERFWGGETVRQLTLGERAETGTRRFIFHVGFCGSTLLARLLGRSTMSLVLKEPQALTDLASQRAAIVAGQAVTGMDALLDHALSCLSRAGTDDAPVVIKPSNWANIALREICTPGREVRGVFVSMERRAFVAAVFRGGRDRIAFCARLCAQISATDARWQRALGKALAASGDPLDQSAHIAALLHAMQERLFTEAMGRVEGMRVDFADIVARPADTADRAAAHLGLDRLPAPAAEADDLLRQHAKDSSRAFSAAERLSADAEIERLHGMRFDAALDWLDTHQPI